MTRFPVYFLLVGIIGLIRSVAGTLSPDGTLPLDCGSVQTFTCSVSLAAVWSIDSPSGGLTIVTDTGIAAAKANSRITTSDVSGNINRSTIAITGFSETDNGTVISCIDRKDGSVNGTVLLLISVPSCPSGVVSDFVSDCTRANVTWEQPPGGPPVTNATVTYCRVSESSCSNSLTCTSPCTVPGLDPTVDELSSGIDYNFTVTPNNNCGSARGCTGNLHNPVRDVPECPERIDVTTPPGNECPKLFWVENDGFASKAIIEYFPTGSSRIQKGLAPGREVCTTNCTIPDLQPNTEYTFKVTLANNCGHASNCSNTNQMNGTPGPSCNGSASAPAVVGLFLAVLAVFITTMV